MAPASGLRTLSMIFFHIEMILRQGHIARAILELWFLTLHGVWTIPPSPETDAEGRQRGLLDCSQPKIRDPSSKVENRAKGLPEKYKTNHEEAANKSE